MDQHNEMEAACHCGTIRFRVKLSDGLKTARRCNCSYCQMRGAVAVSAEAGDISFECGQEALTVYRFNSGVAEHYFCSKCGIYTHHRRRSNPNQFGVNAACLKGVSPFDFEEVPVFDGITHPKDRADGSYRIVGYLRFVPKSAGSTAVNPVRECSARRERRELMGVLTDEMQAAVRAERLAYVATVNADGTPNVAPKGTTTVLDADHLVFADIASPRTVANLRKRPATEVNVVDPLRRKGWRFTGEGRVVNAGAELETLLAFFRDRGVEIERAGRPRVRRVVVIRVHRAHELISPAYDNNAIEADVGRSWISFWHERLARYDPESLAGNGEHASKVK